MSALRTDVQLAEEFGIPLDKFHELRKRNSWPTTRLGRFNYRFTDEQVQQIIAMQTEGGESVARRQVPQVAGQTARSASRRRSA